MPVDAGRLRYVSAFGAVLLLGLSSPVSAVTFTDVTAAAGINHVQSTPAANAGLNGTYFMAGGVAAGDFDNDGLTDLVFTRLGDTDILYKNLGNGTFSPMTAAAGFTTATRTNGVVSGDIDNDGDLDLYMTGAAGLGRNYLYLNNGSGVFTDVSSGNPAALMNGAPRNGQGASFADYDNDGYLDLVTGDWGTPTATSQARLFRNLGASNPGMFEDVTVAAGINVYRNTTSFRYSPRFVDLDRDGHMDLTFASDFHTSQLFWNNGDGTFTDGTLPAGVGTDFNGMGTTFADYDGDGDLDWFITNITADPNIPSGFGGWNRLYRNNGDRTFTDVTQQAGVRDSRWSWGTTFFDADNDSDFDLIATNGFNGGGFDFDRTYFWQNDNGVFTDVSNASGITDTGQGRGLAHLDYDNDGDLDIVIINNEAAPILYRNDGGNAGDYLRIHVEGTDSNRDGIGAFIIVTPDLSQVHNQIVWEIDGGSSFLSQNEHTAHFGLGDSDGVVDLVTIYWPSGLVQELYNIAVNQVITVIEGQPLALPGDLDGDGFVGIADLNIVLGNWNTNVTAGDALMGDPSGDGFVGIEDLNAVLGNWNTGTPPGYAVPEPASLILFVLPGLLAFRQKRSLPR
ncbi:MAG: FG-GAP-like repeat-containing protein [Phycisphaerales bacterium]